VPLYGGIRQVALQALYQIESKQTIDAVRRHLPIAHIRKGFNLLAIDIASPETESGMMPSTYSGQFGFEVIARLS